MTNPYQPADGSGPQQPGEPPFSGHEYPGYPQQPGFQQPGYPPPGYPQQPGYPPPPGYGYAPQFAEASNELEENNDG